MTEDELKKRETRYKSYLTRRSKWEALKSCSRHGVIGVRALRDMMIRLGEKEPFLDEVWEKKVLGDTKLFEHKDDGFFVLTDEADQIEDFGKRPEWEGERPGEDWVREAFDAALGDVPHMEPSAISASRLCLGGDWSKTGEVVVEALDGLKARGVDKPLAKLFDVAWSEAMHTTVHTAPEVHQLALWLTQTMVEVDAFARLRACLKGGDRPADILGPEDGHGSPTFDPVVFRVQEGRLGGLEALPPDESPQGVLGWIRDRLVGRGIMKESA